MSDAIPAVSAADRRHAGRTVFVPLLGAFGVLDALFGAVQRLIGARRMAWVFLVPNLLVFGLFSLWPMLLNFYIAFTGGTSSVLADRPFVGLDNFRELLDCASYLDPKSCPVVGYSFWTGLWNTLFFALVQVPIMIVLALVTALVLNRKIRYRGFWRAVYFYPVMLSPVVIALIWDWILKRRGILNAVLETATQQWNEWVGSGAASIIAGVVVLLVAAVMLGRLPRRYAWPAAAVIAIAVAALLPHSALALQGYRPVNWLVDAHSGWPMFWVIFVYSWGHLGFYMLILLAGLQAIPRDLYEAAEMDGTAPMRQLLRITIPLLTPTLIVVVVLALIRAFQVFDEVYVLTGGGPGQATKMIVQHIYDTAFASDDKRYGIAAASSMLMAALLLVLTLVQLAFSRRKAGG
jgi:ABC-type sugar transport system permease subunit